MQSSENCKPSSGNAEILFWSEVLNLVFFIYCGVQILADSQLHLTLCHLKGKASPKSWRKGGKGEKTIGRDSKVAWRTNQGCLFSCSHVPWKKESFQLWQNLSILEIWISLFWSFIFLSIFSWWIEIKLIKFVIYKRRRLTIFQVLKTSLRKKSKYLAHYLGACSVVIDVCWCCIIRFKASLVRAKDVKLGEYVLSKCALEVNLKYPFIFFLNICLGEISKFWAAGHEKCY